MIRKGEYDYGDVKTDNWLWDKSASWYDEKFYIYDGLTQIGVFWAKDDGEYLLKARAICKKLGKELFVIKQGWDNGDLCRPDGKVTGVPILRLPEYIWYVEHGRQRPVRNCWSFLTFRKYLEDKKIQKEN
jgi:hypothetical protein